MDQGLLSVVGNILQVYASILGIIGMYLVFLRQKKDEQNRELRTRINLKSTSLIDFINREIAPAFKNSPMITVDSQNSDTVIEAINKYELDRKEDIPDVDIDDIKRLLVLWAIISREKEELILLKAELQNRKKDVVLPNRRSMFFIGYFIFELFVGFLATVFIYFDHELQNPIVLLTILFAIGGLFPLSILIYSNR